MDGDWESCLVRWTNCILDARFPDVQSASKWETLHRLTVHLYGNPNDKLPKKAVIEFLENEYPLFDGSAGDETTCEDFVSIASLLLHYACTKSQDKAVHETMCNYLNAADQSVILQFIDNLMKCETVTAENLNRVVNDLSESIGRSEDLRVTMSTPIRVRHDAVTSPRFSSSPLNSSMTPMSNRFRKVFKLEAELGAERFDRNFLQEEVNRLQNKLSELEKTQKESVGEIQRLRSQLSSVNDSDDSNNPDNCGRCKSKEKLLQERMRSYEQDMLRFESDLMQTEDERDSLKTRLENAVKNLQIWQNQAVDLESERDALKSRMCEMSSELSGLRLTLSETTKCLDEYRRERCLNVSIECDDEGTPLRRADTSTTSIPETLSKVIDIQLKEQIETNAGLSEQINKLNHTIEKHRIDRDNLLTTMKIQEADSSAKIERLTTELENLHLKYSDDKNNFEIELEALKTSAQIKNQEYTATIDNLTEMSRNLSKQIETHKSDYSILLNEKAEFSEKINELNHTVDKIEKDNLNYMAKLKDCETIVQLKSEECKTLEANMKTLSDNLTMTISKYSEDNKNLQEEISKLKLIQDTLTKQNLELEAESNNYKSIIQAKNGEVDNLSSVNENLKIEKERLQQLTMQYSEEKNNLIEELKIHKAQLEEIKLSVQITNQEYTLKTDNLKSELENLTEMSRDLVKQVESRENELETCKSDYDVVLNEKNECLANINELNVVVDTMKKDIESYQVQLKNCESIVQLKSEECKALEAKIGSTILTYTEEKQKLEEEIAEFKIVRDTLTKESMESKANINQLEEECKGLKLEITHMMEQNSMDADNYKSIIQAKNNEINDSSSMNEKLKMEKEQLQQLTIQYSEEKNNLIEELKTHKAELEEIKLSVQITNQEYTLKTDDLKSEVENLTEMSRDLVKQVESRENELETCKSDYAIVLNEKDEGLVKINELNIVVERMEKDIESYHVQLKDCESTVQLKSDECKALEAKISSTISTYTEEKYKLEEEIAEFKIVHDALTKESMESKATINRLEDECEGFKSEIAQLVQRHSIESNNYKSVIQTKNNEVKDLNSMTETLRLEKEQLEQSNIDNEKLILQYSEEKNNLIKELKTYKDEAEEFKSSTQIKNQEFTVTIDDLTKTSQDLKQQIESHEVELETCKSDYEVVLNEKNECLTKINELNNAIDRIEKNNASYEVKLKDCEAIVQLKSEACETLEENIKKLNDTIEKYKSDTDDLTTTISTYSEMNRKLGEEIAEFKITQDTFTKESMESKANINQLEDECKSLKSEITRMTEQTSMEADNYKSIIQAKNNEVNNLSSMNENLNIEKGKLQQSNIDNEKRISQLLEEKNDLIEELKTYKDDAEEFKSSMQVKNQEYTVTIDELKIEVENLTKTNQNLKKQIEECKSDYDIILNEKNECLTKINELSDALDRIEKNNSNYEVKLKDCEAIVQSKSKECEALEENIKTLNNTVEKYKSDTDNLTATILTNTEENRKLEEEIAELKIVQDTLTKENFESKATINQMEDESNDLKSEITNKVNDLSSMNENLKIEKESLQQSNIDNEKRISQLVEENNGLIEELKTYRDEVVEFKSSAVIKNHEYTVAIDDLKIELDNSTKTSEDLKNQIEKCKSDYEVILIEKNECLTKINELKDAVDRLEKENTNDKVKLMESESIVRLKSDECEVFEAKTKELSDTLTATISTYTEANQNLQTEIAELKIHNDTITATLNDLSSMNEDIKTEMEKLEMLNTERENHATKCSKEKTGLIESLKMFRVEFEELKTSVQTARVEYGVNIDELKVELENLAETNRSLIKQIESHEIVINERNKLADAVDKFEKDNTNIEVKLKDYESIIQSKADECEELKAKNFEYINEAAKLTEMIEKLKSDCADLTATNTTYSEVNFNLQREITEYKIINDTLIKEKSELNAEHKAVADRLKLEAENSLKEANDRLEDYRETIQSKSNDYENLLNENDEAMSKIRALTDQVEELKASKQREFQSLSAHIFNLASVMRNQEIKMIRIDDSVKEYESKIERCNARLGEKIAEFRSIKNEIKIKDNLIETLNLNRSEIQIKYEASAKIIEDLIREKEEISVNVEKLKTDASRNYKTLVQFDEMLQNNLKLTEILRMKESEIGELRDGYDSLLKRSQNDAPSTDQLIVDLRSEYEDKLTRMKEKMKQLYTDEIKTFSEKQREEQANLEKLCKKYTDKIRNYESHVNQLSSELWKVGEKLLMERNEKEMLKLKLKEKSSSIHSLNSITSTISLPQTKIEVSSNRRPLPGADNAKSRPSMDARRHLFKTPASKVEMGGLHVSDEESEIFDNRHLNELKAGNRNFLDFGSDKNRLSELQWRNSLCLPHLKSSYPAETQFQKFAEEDIKDDLRRQKKEAGQIMYNKPGPPTPSKKGRASLQGNEIREPLKEQQDNAANKAPTTPSRFKSFFKGNTSKSTSRDENTFGTPKGRRISIFRKPK